MLHYELGLCARFPKTFTPAPTDDESSGPLVWTASGDGVPAAYVGSTAAAAVDAAPSTPKTAVPSTPKPEGAPHTPRLVPPRVRASEKSYDPDFIGHDSHDRESDTSSGALSFERKIEGIEALAQATNMSPIELVNRLSDDPALMVLCNMTSSEEIASIRSHLKTRRRVSFAVPPEAFAAAAADFASTKVTADSKSAVIQFDETLMDDTFDLAEELDAMFPQHHPHDDSWSTCAQPQSPLYDGGSARWEPDAMCPQPHMPKPVSHSGAAPRHVGADPGGPPAASQSQAPPLASHVRSDPVVPPAAPNPCPPPRVVPPPPRVVPPRARQAGAAPVDPPAVAPPTVLKSAIAPPAARPPAIKLDCKSNSGDEAADEDVALCADRNAYMRFYNKMQTKKAKMYPELLARFIDKSKRPELFKDFFASGENLDKVQITHTRRVLQEQFKEAELVPMTDAELMDRYKQDAVYVALVKQDCVVKGRVQVDPLCPTDVSKNRYWVIGKECLSLRQGTQLEFTLQQEFEATGADAKAMTAAGGMFSMVGNMDFGGMASGSIDAAQASFFAGPGAAQHTAPTIETPPQKKAKNKAAVTPPVPPKATAGTTGVAGAFGAAADVPKLEPVAAVPDSPLVAGQKMAISLAKFAGESRETALRMASVNASQTLVIQLYGVAKSCEEQYKAFQPLISKKVNDSEVWASYMEAATAMVDFYKDKKQYCNALLGVAKKQQTNAAKAASPAVQPAINEHLEP